MANMAAKIRRSSRARGSSATGSDFNIDMIADFDAAMVPDGGKMDVDAGAGQAAPPAPVPGAPPQGVPAQQAEQQHRPSGPQIVMQGHMQKKGDGFGFLSRWQDR